MLIAWFSVLLPPYSLSGAGVADWLSDCLCKLASFAASILKKVRVPAPGVHGCNEGIAQLRTRVLLSVPLRSRPAGPTAYFIQHSLLIIK